MGQASPSYVTMRQIPPGFLRGVAANLHLQMKYEY